MRRKFLIDALYLVVGKVAEELVDLLDTKKHVNEFTIAKKLDITINQTRNLLYRLSDHGLVSSIRKKDKKKGWYTYFWKIEAIKCFSFLKGHYVKRINQFKNQINSRETKNFYVCETCNIEFNEENALLCDFTCNECGEIFTVKNNLKVLKEFRKHLNVFEKELDLLEEELDKEKNVIEKKKARGLKKEEKEKAAKKAVKKAERAAERAKEKAKEAKKNPVKKKSQIKKKVAKKKVVKSEAHPRKSSKKISTKGKKKVVKKKPIKKKTPLKKKVVKILKSTKKKVSKK